MPAFCVNCRYAEFFAFASEPVNVVTGQHDGTWECGNSARANHQDHHNMCAYERGATEDPHCGPAGKHFKPKLTGKPCS